MKSGKTISVVILLCAVISCTPEAPELLNVDFSEWDLLNDQPITLEIPGHGAGERNIFINSVGLGVTATARDGRVYWDYPDGTVILKTVRGPDMPADSGGQPMLLGMIKDPQHPESQGEWIWVTRDPRTGEEAVIDSEFCVSCHADANEVRRADAIVPVGVANPNREFRDFVFFPYYPAE